MADSRIAGSSSADELSTDASRVVASLTKFATAASSASNQAAPPGPAGVTSQRIQGVSAGGDVHLTQIHLSVAESKEEELSEAEANLILPRLRIALKTKYQQDATLKRLFDGNEVSINQAYINLALIKETERKAKEKGLGAEDKKGEEVNANENDKKIEDHRLASHEELYAVKEPIALTELFEPEKEVEGQSSGRPKKGTGSKEGAQTAISVCA